MKVEMATFESLGLRDWLIQQCKQMGINRPTLVQENCIPAILEGKDVKLLVITALNSIGVSYDLIVMNMLEMA